MTYVISSVNQRRSGLFCYSQLIPIIESKVQILIVYSLELEIKSLRHC